MEEDDKKQLIDDYFNNSDEDSITDDIKLNQYIQKIEEQDQKQQMQQIPEYPVNRLVHFQIEIQTGRFEIIFLVDQLQEIINNLDMSGYTILHHAITYNRLDIFNYLLSVGADPNIKSGLNQTSLMIACNFGNREMIRELIQRGADVNARDNFNFNALLYAWKAKFYDIVLYLIYFTDDWLETVDHNLCSLQHWSAYNNDKGIPPKVHESIQYKQIQTPLTRAISNNSYESVKYLITKSRGEVQISPNLQSLAIKDLLNKHNKQIQLGKENPYKKIIELWYQKILCVLIFIEFFFFAKVYLDLSLNKTEEQINTQNFMMGFFLVLSYTTVYSIWFIMKSTTTSNDGKIIVKHQLGDPHLSHPHDEQEDKFNWFTFQQTPPYLDGFNQEEFDRIDFSVVKQLKQKLYKDNNDDEEKQNNKYNILDHIYYFWQTKKFKNLKEIDFSRICPECLVYQPPRTKHIQEYNTCVEDFHHKSIVLKKCISSSNHLFYMLFLIAQFFVLAAFNFNVINIYWNKVDSYLFFLLELIIRLYQEESLIDFTFLLITLESFIYLTLYLSIEIYLVFANLTYDEFIDNQNYRYLFEVQQERMKFKYRFPEGYIQNLHNYLGHSFNKLKLR